MCARLSILLTATLLGVWTGGLAAQDSIVPGARVRLVTKAPRVSPSAPDTHTVAVKGSVVAVNGHSLLIARQTPPDTVSVPLARIFRLEVEVRESHETRGALIGAGVGVAIGLLIAVPEVKKCAGIPNCYAYFHPAIIPITFGLFGGTLGGRLGRGSWRRVPIPEIGAGYSPRRSRTTTFALRLWF